MNLEKNLTTEEEYHEEKERLWTIGGIFHGSFTPTPYSLHSAPYALHPTPYTLRNLKPSWAY